MLGRETIPGGESEATRRVVAASRALLATGEGPVLRQQHAKQHGCVRAEFVVEPDLPPEYRVGLFREPRTYSAWVRFSNGARGDDREPDAHGMAVKLMGVDGPKVLDAGRDATTHDFVMVDDPAFFVADADEYARLTAAMLKARGAEPSLVRSALGFLPGKARVLLTLALIYFIPFRIGMLLRLRRFAGKRHADPLSARYWSTTPYLFGEGMAMKFTAVPEATGPAAATALPPEGASADYLREAMAARLAAGGVSFEFKVQLQVDERSTPVEDPTVVWGEDVAPPRTVARIKIPAQEFGSAGQMAFSENLSFTPWHAVPEHRPLGGINRVRKSVYSELCTMRHDLNRTTVREPEPGDPPVGPPALEPGPTTFDQVLREELELIRARRREVEGPEVESVEDDDPGANIDRRLMAARVSLLDEHVTGLSFSGGGIRAGTFAVGVLQGLATLGLLKRFDYLSTVSGGGYAGAWVAAWMKRDGSPENVELQLNPNRVIQSRADREYLHGGVVDEEPEPVRHLRAFSSYMSPRSGPLSVDTWTVILIWARNVVINLMMLLPACMLVVIGVRLVVFAYGFLNPNEQGEDLWKWWLVGPLLVVGAIGLWLAFKRNAAALREFRTGDPKNRLSFGTGDVAAVVVKKIVRPALVAAVCLTVSLRWALSRLTNWLDRPLSDVVDSLRGAYRGLRVGGARPEPPGFDIAAAGWRLPWDYIRSHLGPGDVPIYALHALLFGGLIALGALRISLRDRTGRPWKFVGAAFMAGATGGVLLVLLEALTAWFSRLDRPDLMATLVPPLALLILVAGLIVEVAMLGRSVFEAEREWWARVSATLTLAAIIWLGVTATVVYVPGLYLWLGPAARAAVASGWLGTAAFGVITGRYVLPRVGGRGLASVASLASLAFLVGLVGAVALLASALANVPSLGGPRGDFGGPFSFYLEGVKGSSFLALVATLVVSVVLFRLARRLIDVNLFSLHAMYANRLTRAYLGASRSMRGWVDRWADPRDPRDDAGAPSLGTDANAAPPVTRDANPVTGFDPGDDFNLADLRIGAAGGGGGGRRYLGPHLLLNTTLNLVGGDELAVRDRKGDSFTLSPLYCGSKSLGYARTDATGDNLTLGSAVAISGAAVDPNMSIFQSGPLTALLTLFNARLGYWIEKPKAANWTAASPKFGKLLFTEFLGRTDGRGDFVHLSDGWHFENLGVYELVRRRCRYIVAIDAGSDADPSDADLAKLIRLCRIDFGVRIRIDTAPLAVAGPDRLSRSHAVIGTIHYDDVDQGEMPGVLVYIKSTLTGDEPPDVQKYARVEPTFPLQSTDLRQSFDEEQFESYKCLGDHIAREVFGEPVGLVRDYFPAGASPTHKEYVPRLFSATQLRWSEAPKGEEERISGETARAWNQLQRDLATLPELAALSRDLYPELPAPTAEAPAFGPAERARAELLAVARMLGVVQEAWLSLGLKRSSGSPVNRGWMNAFRRWTATRAFVETWPTLRAQQNAEFTRFCEDELHASTAPPAAVRLPGPPGADTFEGRALAEMAAEFAREWPDEAAEGWGIHDRVGRAARLGLPEAPVWLIVSAPAGGVPGPRFAAGVVIGAAFPDHPVREVMAAAGKPPVEMFVWVRPPHRSSGLASRTVRDVVKKVSDELSGHARDQGQDRPTLWARYPRSGAGEDDRGLMLWLSFFARYDFRRKYLKMPAGVRPVTLLERRVKG